MTSRLLPSAALLAMLPLGSALAGGFQTLPASATALGLGGAMTAMGRDASAAWFNPGAMGLLDSASVTVGVAGMRIGRAFRSFTTDAITRAESPLTLAPFAYVATPLDSAHHWIVGLSVNSPFGYDTKWPADWQGRSLVRESRIRSLYIQPTVAFRVSNRFSIGGGVDLVGADYMLDRAVGEFDATAASFKASGKGIGFNLGIYGRAGDAIAFGITYRSTVKVKMTNGQATFTGVPASQAARFPATSDFNTAVRLPSQLSAGISNHLTDRLLLNFTFELTGWSVVDSTNLTFTSGAQARATERLGRRYEDAMTFRVGAEYQYTDALALRVGLYYDESPVRDQNITADLADANILGGCVGAGYRLGRHLSVDAAYTYGYSALRRSKADGINQNNVPAIGGTFRNNQHGGALNLSYYF